MDYYILPAQIPKLSSPIFIYLLNIDMHVSNVLLDCNMPKTICSSKYPIRYTFLIERNPSFHSIRPNLLPSAVNFDFFISIIP